ncbi:MAG: hypothetical protein RIG68_00800 [Imperialibacter sp.]|uniref:outer membrane beta-barrel protein n=1 Tax=Imperialibacter sp. TaxID=2038411 RepID=UPI0032ECCAB9
MKKVAQFLMAVAFCLTTHLSFSQQGYISTDSTLNTVEVIGGSAYENAQFIKVATKSGIVTYSPLELSEYRLNDGRVFHSFPTTVSGEEVHLFFERIFHGRYMVYSLAIKHEATRYFITPADTVILHQLPDGKQLASFLKQYVQDCPAALENTPFVKLSKNSLVRFFGDYDLCWDRYFPRFRYGVKGGLALTTLTAQKAGNLFSTADFHTAAGLSFGLEVHVPMGRTNMSFVTEPTFYHYKSSTLLSDSRTYDLVTNQYRVNVPALFRYNAFNVKNVPFIELGPTYSRYLGGENLLFSYNTTDNDIFIGIEESSAIAKDQLGFTLNVGLMVKYDSKQTMTFQMGINNLYSVGKQSELLGVTQICFSAGLLF